MGSRGTVTGSGTDERDANPSQQPLDRPPAVAGAERRAFPIRFPGWLSRATLPLTATPPRPLRWASWASAALSVAYIAWAVPSPIGIVFAIALPLLMLRFPVTGIVLVALLAQEIKPNGRFGALTTLGYQAYYGAGKVPVVLLLALTAALAAAAQRWPQESPRPRSAGGALLGLAAALVVLASSVGLLHGQSVFSAVNQNARPFVLLVLGLLIGMSLRRLRGERKSLSLTVGAVLVGLLVAAAVAIPLGEIADDRLSSYFVYYDSALPAIAAAVLIGVLGDNGWRWDWRHMTVVAAAPLLVLISFRRSVWLASLVALIVVLVLSWPRWRQVVRQLAFAAVVAAVVVLGAPGFAADLGLRSVGSFALGNGGPTGNGEPTASAASTAPGGPSAKAAPSPTGGLSASVPPTAPGGPSAAAKPSAMAEPVPTAEPIATARPGNTARSSDSGAASPSSGPDGPTTTAGPPSQPAPAPPTEKSAVHQAESTSGHLSDLRLGWAAVRADPWTGVGPLAPQLSGMAAQNAERVYVHNELLQTWLRYGPFAPLLVVLFLAAAALLAMRTIRDPDSDGIVRSAAAFCLITPLCVMTAPFLSETSRWPLVVGIAAGIVARFWDRDRHEWRTSATQ